MSIMLVSSVFLDIKMFVGAKSVLPTDLYV